jgi:hypothetical protein
MNTTTLLIGLALFIGAAGFYVVRQRLLGRRKSALLIPGANSVIWAVYDIGVSDAQDVLRWVKENRRSALDKSTIETVLKEGSGDLFAPVGGRFDLVPQLRMQMDSRSHTNA